MMGFSRAPQHDHGPILRQILAEIKQVRTDLASVSTKESQIMSALSDAVARIVSDIKAAVAILQNDAASEADTAAAIQSLNDAAAAAEAAVPAIHSANPSAPAPAAPSAPTT